MTRLWASMQRAYDWQRQVNRRSSFDVWLLLSSLSLILLGWVVVSSASVAVADAWTGNPQYFSTRQGLFIVLALVAALVVSRIPLAWANYPFAAIGAALGLLVIVLLIGREVNGSTRWISLGPFNLQTSELAKIALMVYLSSYLVRHLDAVRSTLSGFVNPLIVVFIYGVLLILQPDFGGLVVVLIAVMAMLFLAGARFQYFLLMLCLAVLLLTVIAYLEPYRVQRLTSFTDPWARQFDSGYQLTQALIAYGRGAWTGLGLGNSVQKLFYLPEAHTDFVFSILAEELGLIGALITLGLFVLMISRIYIIGRLSELSQHYFAAYLCYGLATLFAAQVLINLGVNTGLLPTKGLTLPLISYGGSSLLASGIMLGLVFRADKERRQAGVKERSNGAKASR